MQSFLYLRGPFTRDFASALIWQAFQCERFYEAGILQCIDHTWVQRVFDRCLPE